MPQLHTRDPQKRGTAVPGWMFLGAILLMSTVNTMCSAKRGTAVPVACAAGAGGRGAENLTGECCCAHEPGEQPSKFGNTRVDFLTFVIKTSLRDSRATRRTQGATGGRTRQRAWPRQFALTALEEPRQSQHKAHGKGQPPTCPGGVQTAAASACWLRSRQQCRRRGACEVPACQR